MEVNMTKIMLVEDDKSLREIYGVRLIAEGYEIISVGDGEAALAMAVKEKPDLILSDVMMPKISGFDMLDILRSTPETKDVKVIMMTALSSEDQRARGESLGANKYLVKSQVGIEDVVRTVHEVLADSPVIAQNNVQRFSLPVETAAETPIAQPVAPTAAPEVPVAPIAVPVQQQAAASVEIPSIPTVVPVQVPQMPEVPAVTSTLPPAPQPVISIPIPPVVPEQTMAAPIQQPIQPITEPQPVAQEMPVAAPIEPLSIPQPAVTPVPAPVAPMAPVQLPQPTAPFSSPAPASLGDRIINPITPPTPPVDIAMMMNQELNGVAPVDQNQTPPQF